jgi:hypothetical protein
MLQAMQQPAERAPSPVPTTFVGMLAAIASPAPARDPGLSLDGLEDDVATFSYEGALRPPARFLPAESGGQLLSQNADQAHQAEMSGAAGPANAGGELDSNQRLVSAHDKNLKSASITIRLSQSECAQLHQRAAEAGFTVSAYLRSCVFEAESLRAQVKETLAELRLAASAQIKTDSDPPPRSRFRRLLRVVAPWRDRRGIAEA